MLALARLAAFAAAATLCSQARAAVLTSTTTEENKVIISLVGNIVIGYAATLLSLIKAAQDARRTLAAVRLDSAGGNLVEGIELARQIRAARTMTVVADGNACASACFLALAGGVKKSVGYSAHIGVHGVSDSSGQETIEAYAATVSLARIAKDFGVPEAIIGKMVVTPPTTMVWLSAQDLRSMGVTMTGRLARTSTAKPISLQSDTGTLSRQPELSKTLSWQEFVNSMMDASSHQNEGKPRTDRTCEPEAQTCVVDVYSVGRDKRDMLAQTTEDLDGNIVRKLMCELNRYKDIRTCRDWDTGQFNRFVKDHVGRWIEVESPS